MTAARRFLLHAGVVAVIALAAACGAVEPGQPQATATRERAATTRPVPTPVDFAQEPQGATLGDPAFEAMAGAQARFGRLGGSIYQIEMPDRWNGRLVLYLHGFRDFAPTLTVQQPGIRGYLIRNGYAWGASSYSSNSLVPGLAADETAALWDHFVQEFGRPERTYVTGHSMGGGAAAISAERYPDRYDGGMALCGIAGNTPELAFLGDYVIAGAFAAGVTQAEFDAAPIDELIDDRILPALDDPALHDRFEALVIELTGGPRPFAREGFLRRETANWEAGEQILGAGLFDNRETAYRLGPLSDVQGEEYNAGAIRVNAGPVQGTFTAGHDTTGDIQIPLLTLHNTGDLFVPISQQQVLARKAEAAGKDDLLVQRAVQSPGHCTFTNSEWITGLEALVAWVEEGDRPDGEDLLAEDLTNAGEAFTLAPRLGSPEAEDVPGAGERITLRGTLTLDGEPFDGFLLGVVVRADGLERSCGFERFLAVSGGDYEVAVAAAGEATGCGAPGAQVFLTALADGQILSSQETANWPADGTGLQFDATFSSADRDGVSRPVTIFTGGVAGPSGETPAPGTVVEAYIGETLCGVSSLPPVVMASGDPVTYQVRVAGPDSVPGCSKGAEISFRVDGQPAEQTTVHDMAREPHLLDLTPP